MEIARWIDWRRGVDEALKCDRVYLGEETCEHRLPSLANVSTLVEQLVAHEVAISLVTPILSDSGLKAARALVIGLQKIVSRLEVICSDWGMLAWVAEDGNSEPVAGRLLATQQTDPRIARMLDETHQVPLHRPIQSLEGEWFNLRYRPPTCELVSHFRNCTLDRDRPRRFLMSRGVRRFELNNVVQGIELQEAKGWTYTLHVPYVLVSVMRRCPASGEDMTRSARCSMRGICEENVAWRCESFPVELARKGNALYYVWPTLPTNLTTLPISRIVHHT